MTTPNESLLEFARGHFRASDFAVEPIEKGGSERSFYRIRAGNDGSLIAVCYTNHREENRHFVDIARFLEACGVRVPRIYHHDPERGLIFMEDLGEVDLWQWRDASWPERRELYSLALGEVARLHGEGTRRVEGCGLRLEREFSEQLYLWEQNYFVEHCLAGVFRLPEDEARALGSSETLANIARTLAALPRSLVHRDFQSQNVLVRQGACWLIDFQGMRPGLPHYDVASLLYDPYVNLSEPERGELVSMYLDHAGANGVRLEGDFRRVLDMCAVQRLMQAMGAYGFLGLRQGRPRFLSHVRPAQRSLRLVLARVGGAGPLERFLERAEV